jgi:hypothetical protein
MQSAPIPATLPVKGAEERKYIISLFIQLKSALTGVLNFLRIKQGQVTINQLNNFSGPFRYLFHP